ncbi:hypothetical protein [Rosistilla oblonga]|uniref:hypothetical protein n=1 Tax=Rosistilla oblonga TaxID=2527990 RepID=UPI003A9884EE
MSSINVEQVVIGKHVKIHSGDLKLDVHASKSCIGVWLGGKGQSSGDGCVGAAANINGETYLMAYPNKSFWDKGAAPMPFAMSVKSGLQIPQPNGEITTFSLKELSSAALQLRKLLDAASEHVS